MSWPIRPPPARRRSRRPVRTAPITASRSRFISRITAKDVDVTVRFKPVAGTVDQAGGIAVRLATRIITTSCAPTRSRTMSASIGSSKGDASRSRRRCEGCAGPMAHARAARRGRPLHRRRLTASRSTPPRTTPSRCRQGRAVDQGRQRDPFRHDLDHPARLTHYRYGG